MLRLRSLDIVLASILILSVVLNQGVLYIKGEFSLNSVLWYCDIATLVLAVALLLKNSLLASTVFLTAIPAQALWIWDFFLTIFSKSAGRNSWILTGNITDLMVYSSLFMHFLLIPVSLWAIFRFGFRKVSVFLAIVAVFILFVLTVFFTSPHFNVNCAFNLCDSLSPRWAYRLLGSGNWSLIFNNTLEWSVYIFAIYIISLPIFKKINWYKG